MDPDVLCSPDIGKLAAAMLKVHRALAPAARDAENPFVKTRYASLNAVMDACRDALLSNGVWAVQAPVPVDQGHLGLMTKLVHAETGQWQSAVMIVPLPKNDPQGYGSALTYARRYGLATIVGLVTELDDDGLMASSTKSTAQSGLPKLDGVTYQSVQTPDGQTCITAAGNTQAKKAFLQQAGFRWDRSRKIWWRYAEQQAA